MIFETGVRVPHPSNATLVPITGWQAHLRHHWEPLGQISGCWYGRSTQPCRLPKKPRHPRLRGKEGERGRRKEEEGGQQREEEGGRREGEEREEDVREQERKWDTNLLSSQGCFPVAETDVCS